MRSGKLTNEQLERLILSKYTPLRPEVVQGAGVGVDCAAVDVKGELVVLSTDPITAASKNMGAIAVHVCCNDAAAAGAEPIGVLITLLLPHWADEELIGQIASDVAHAARDAGVDVLGGHTEVTDAVTRPVISATVVARTVGGRILDSRGAKPGDHIVMTKWAGLEGTAIIAQDFSHRLEGLSSAELEEARSLTDCLSVVKEGVLGRKMGVHAMHDITEGGVLGAVWEMCAASRCGAELSRDHIPILDVTRRVCALLELDPLKLISSGSMLMACADGPGLIQALGKEGIEAAVIGKATSGPTVTLDGREVPPPEADELLRLLPG